MSAKIIERLLRFLRPADPSLDTCTGSPTGPTEFNMAQASGVVKTTVLSGKPMDECMADLLAYCAQAAPDPGWNTVGGIDLSVCQKSLEDWLDSTLTASPPGDNVRAYYFGIAEIVNGSDSMMRLYVCGADEFDPDDESMDWACDPVYWPESRYAPAETLAQFSGSLRVSRSARPVGEYVLSLGYACLATRDLMQSLNLALLLGSAGTRAVAVGFDEGDAIVLGQLTRDGFRPAATKPGTSAVE